MSAFPDDDGPSWWDRWREIADGVLVRRHRSLDLNVSLVLGDERCLVVDTHSHDAAARVLIESIRSVTPLPWVVLNTHAHFDHCFGNAAFAAAQPGLEIWGHERCATTLRLHGERQRRATAAWMQEAGNEDDAAAIGSVTIVEPNHTFTQPVRLDLGGRHVDVHHPGRGHTDHDVVVDIADASVTLAGDLVEQGAPPAFEDGFPLEWPRTLTTLLPGLQAQVVPGHGDVVDAEFVAAQRDQLSVVADVARALPVDVDDAAILRAAVSLPVGRQAGLTALRRALVTR